jgi:hypothetical protein
MSSLNYILISYVDFSPRINKTYDHVNVSIMPRKQLYIVYNICILFTETIIYKLLKKFSHIKSKYIIVLFSYTYTKYINHICPPSLLPFTLPPHCYPWCFTLVFHTLSEWIYFRHVVSTYIYIYKTQLTPPYN